MKGLLKIFRSFRGVLVALGKRQHDGLQFLQLCNALEAFVRNGLFRHNQVELFQVDKWPEMLEPCVADFQITEVKHLEVRTYTQLLKRIIRKAFACQHAVEERFLEQLGAEHQFE